MGPGTDLMNFTAAAITAIKGNNAHSADELLLDVMNVWTPKGERRSRTFPSARPGASSCTTRGAGHEWPTRVDEDAEPGPESKELVARRGPMLAKRFLSMMSGV